VTEPVRWGFLGAGWIATKALAPAVHAASGAVLQSVAARDPERARALDPAGAVYGAYADLLDDDSVEAVYICLANDAHRPWAVAATEAGKHVLCEKPLALSAAEVDEMTAAAAASGRLLVEASWYRWHPRVRLAQSMIREGAIGTVREVSAGFTFDGSLDGNYRLDPAMGGGAMYDVGCYAVSAALWAFGGAPVREVTATFELGPSGVDLVATAALSLDAGRAEVRAGIREAPRQWLVVRGDGGELSLPDSAFTAWVQDDTELVVDAVGESRRTVMPATDAYRLMVEQVSAAVRGEPAWVVPLAESRATAAVLDACFASARSGGRPVGLVEPT
jgi:predicted dehydrogenase